MPVILDLVMRLIAGSVEFLSAPLVGSAPLLLAALAVAVVAVVVIAVVAAVRGYRGFTPSVSRGGLDHDLVRPLVAQSHPDAAGHVRARAPGAR